MEGNGVRLCPVSQQDGEMMFQIKMTDARLWKNLIGAISTLVDEASFDADEKSIKLRAMDPSHVAMVDFEWPEAIFTEYNCDKPTKLCINISEMLKLLRRVGGDESLELELDEQTGQIKMILRGKYTRTFKMATLETLSEEVPTPRISFNSLVKITSSCIRDAINDAATISDFIIFQTEQDKFVMQASGNLGSVVIEVDKESEEILGFDVKVASKAMFGLNYLSDMVKAASTVSDLVTLEFSTNMPIRLNFELPHKGKLQYYLAPRIESD
jgi:proliferating cell nuclear antigen